VTARDWLRRYGTPRLYQYLFEPLLHVKWGQYKDDISAAWIWGRIHPRATSRGKDGEEKAGYFAGSYAVVLDRMLDFARQKGASILTGAPCLGMKIRDGRVTELRYRLSATGHEERVSDPVVVSTVAPRVLLQLTDGMSDDDRDRLGAMKYEGVICVLLSMKRPLTSLCQIPVAPGQVRFGGIVEWTNFVPPRYFGGEHLVYLFTYLPDGRPEWAETDDTLLGAYLEDLQRVIPTFSRADLNWCSVFRNKFATPVFETGFLRYMPSWKTAYAGLYMGGMFNTYPVTDFNQGIRIARTIVDDICGSPRHRA
jgi:protoporphyrinogen oxidase